MLDYVVFIVNYNSNNFFTRKVSNKVRMMDVQNRFVTTRYMYIAQSTLCLSNARVDKSLLHNTSSPFPLSTVKSQILVQEDN